MTSPRTKGLRFLAAAAFLASSVAPGAAQAPAEPQSSIDIAIIGEPGPMEPMAVTADLISILTQHIFETLYAFDEQWEIAPLLASDMPTISEDGLLYTIPLRSDVRFHDGSAMEAEDVVASLERWMALSPRGKLAAESVEEIAAEGEAVTIRLSEPFAPLLSLLAYGNAAAVIIPAENAANRDVLSEHVGTGPFTLIEHRPDQYIRMGAFADYAPASGEPSRYAGSREALIDELRFVPVPNANTRVDGVLAGQYEFADSLPAEMLPRLQNQEGVEPLIVRPFGWPFMLLNQAEGVLANQTIRQAVLAALAPEDMMLAAFGDPEFFELEGSIYPEGTPFHDEASAESYNQADPEKAAELLREAGYNNEPIRILTSQQYDFLYRMSLVAQANLQQAGFNVDLQVLDWATLLQRRAEPDAWEAFFTYINFVPEPSLLTFMNAAYPGWWDTPEKQAALEAFNTTIDPAERAERWKEIQELIYTQVPAIKIGNFFNLAAMNTKLEGYEVTNWPFFWNVRVAE